MLNEILENLATRTRGVTAAAVLDTDGLSLGSAGSGSIDGEVVAAIAASLVDSAEELTGEFGQGELQTATLSGKDGTTVLSRCGDGLVLAVLASPKARLGLLLVDVRRAAVAVAGAL